jgi:hypothetical protein
VTDTQVPAGYHPVGPRDYLDRLLAEYQLSAADVAGAILVRTPPAIGGKPGPPQYLISGTLLRPHDPFPCAGDAEAREFCLNIVSEIVLASGLSRREAVELVNRHWSVPAPGRLSPRIWIVGLDLAYHEDPSYWAQAILEQTR